MECPAFRPARSFFVCLARSFPVRPARSSPSQGVLVAGVEVNSMDGHTEPSKKPSPKDDRRLPPVLLALTLTTGLIDAASYLGLGHVFTANMTGNVVLLGFGLANAGGLPVVAPLVSLGAFLLGAGIGGRLGVGIAR